LNKEYDEILCLPHTEAERKWLEERLETLSERESIMFAVARQQHPPGTAAGAINLLALLEDYEIYYPASSYESLGRFYLDEAELELPELVLEHTDMESLGFAFEDDHPGLFVGDCYVEYPHVPMEAPYSGTNLASLEDDWIVKVKLASPHKPEGVWLRLPDCSKIDDYTSDEVALALRALGVDELNQCTILDARCVFPEAGNLTEQYDDPEELIRDGSDLGCLLGARPAGMKSYERKLAAAMEFEGCATLKDVITCADEIRKYSFVLSDKLEEYARSKLLKAGAPEALIDAGLFDLKGFARASLEQNGYCLDRSESVYLKLRQQEQELTQGAMTMQ